MTSAARSIAGLRSLFFGRDTPEILISWRLRRGCALAAAAPLLSTRRRRYQRRRRRRRGVWRPAAVRPGGKCPAAGWPFVVDSMTVVISCRLVAAAGRGVADGSAPDAGQIAAAVAVSAATDAAPLPAPPPPPPTHPLLTAALAATTAAVRLSADTQTIGYVDTASEAMPRAKRIHFSSCLSAYKWVEVR